MSAAIRTELEIVVQTERLARLLMKEFYGTVPTGPGVSMRSSTHPRAQHCWKVACDIQETLTGTDAENASAELGEPS